MKTNRRVAAFALAGLISVFSGCASYPMGLSKAKWDVLPPEIQARLMQDDAREARQGVERSRDQLARDVGEWRATDDNTRRVGN